MAHLDGGVSLVWAIHPRHRIVTVYTADRTARVLHKDGVLEGAGVLPGSPLPVAEIFRYALL